MSPKNIIIYALNNEAVIPSSENLLEGQFIETITRNLSDLGFVNPVTGLIDNNLVHSVNGYTAISLRVDEKIIPSGAVKKLVGDKVREIEAEQGKRLPKKEVTALKDEIIFDLIPKAMIKSSTINAYFDIKNGLIIVDASSSNKAELLLTFLRNTLGSLAVRPLASMVAPSFVMTNWMLNVFPDDVTPLDAVSIINDEDGGAARFKKTNLLLPQVIEHLSNGGQVSQIDLQWNDSVSFSLSSNLTLKKIKLLDAANQDKGEAETAADRFDADFVLFAGIVAELFDVMMGWFGGREKA